MTRKETHINHKKSKRGAEKREKIRESCKGKVKYKTKTDADNAADFHTNRTQHFLQSYLCPECKLWHIGRVIPRGMRRELR